jgi:hypothetical protein
MRRAGFRRTAPLQSRPVREPVAVIAETLTAAREAARRLAADGRLPGPPTPCTPASYLRRDASPSRVVLCAPSGAASDAAAFLRRCAARLLWPPPHAELHSAIDGIRPEAGPPRPLKRPPAPPWRRHSTSARLLEGRVDRRRADAALDAGKPYDWIVESPRHVLLSDRELDALGERGVRWSALEPVELVGIVGPASLARSRREWGPGLPPGVPFWTR